MRWRRTAVEKKYSAVTRWEIIKPNLVAIFVCGIVGHDKFEKFSGTKVCRRNCH